MNDKKKIHLLVDTTLGRQEDSERPEPVDLIKAVFEKSWNHFIDLDISFRYKLPDDYRLAFEGEELPFVLHLVDSKQKLEAISSDPDLQGLFEPFEELEKDLIRFKPDLYSVLITRPLDSEQGDLLESRLPKKDFSELSGNGSEGRRVAELYFNTRADRPAFEIIFNRDLPLEKGLIEAISLGKFFNDNPHFLSEGYSSLHVSTKEIEDTEWENSLIRKEGTNSERLLAVLAGGSKGTL